MQRNLEKRQIKIESVVGLESKQYNLQITIYSSKTVINLFAINELNNTFEFQMIYCKIRHLTHPI